MLYECSVRWKKLAGILCLIFVILFFILNVFTPLIADDFSYSLGIHSVSDVVAATYNLYFDWSGRVLANFTAQFWLFIGKPIFNIANTLVYCLFVFLIQFHITGSRKYNPIIFLAINIFLWFFVPAWGQNFIWLDGSCVYLWTSIPILLFLIPFRKRYENINYMLNLPLSVLLFFLGVFAGCSVENAAAGMLFLLIFYFIMKRVNKNKIAKFEVLGTLGFLIGFLVLILAPGNYVRLREAELMSNGYGDLGIIAMALKHFASITFIFGKQLGFMLIAVYAILSFDLVYNKKYKLNVFSCFYALAAVASAYSMLLSPAFPPRAFLMVIVFSCIALGNILLQTEIKLPEIIRRNATAIAVCCLIGYSFSFLNSTRNIVEVYLEWNRRIKYIEMEKSKGNFDIELRAPIPVWDKHTALYGLHDIMHGKDEFPNPDIAKYFGLSSIKKMNEDGWK